MQIRQMEQPITSNTFTLSDALNRLGWLIPTDPNQSRENLLAQYQAQGYLWLKGILKRDNVLDFRRRFFDAFIDTGLLVAGTATIDGLYFGREAKGFVGCPLDDFSQNF